jgi:adenine deaminase
LTKLGIADTPLTGDFVTMGVFERHGKNGNIGIAPVAGLGMTHGAIAGTVSHDCHNLFVIGANPDDMLLAAQTVIEIGGGFACADKGRVTAKLALPICGLMSEKPATELQPEVAALKEVLVGFGIRAPSPLNLLTAFSLAVLPEIRLTDYGIVNTRTQTIVPLYAD